MDKDHGIAALERVMRKLEAVFIDDSQVRGAFYCGSCGRGNYDQYSDIDMILVVDEADQREFFLKVPDILASTVGLKSAANNEGQDVEWCCLVSDDYIGLDLVIATKSDLVPGQKYAEIEILKDDSDFLSEFRQLSSETLEPFDDKKFLNIIEDIKDGHLYIARFAARGWRLKAQSNCIHISEQLYFWLLRLRGFKYVPPDVRNAENILTEYELDLLKKTRSKSTELKDIKESTDALWELTGHVIAEYEKVTGVLFPPSYDPTEFRKLIDDVFMGTRF